MSDEDLMAVDVAFHLKRRTPYEHADYDKGFAAGDSGIRMTTPKLLLGSADEQRRKTKLLPAIARFTRCRTQVQKRSLPPRKYLQCK